MDKESARSLARIMAMEQTFETEGWKEIIAELTNEIEVIKGQLLTAPSWDSVKFLQGKSEQCWRMIFLADAIANLREQIIAENSNAAV